MMAMFVLLFACGMAPAPHDHDAAGHDHGDRDGDAHAHDGDAHDHDGAEHAAKPATREMEGTLGSYSARLEPSAEALRLVLTDVEGQPVAAEGDVRVVLTGAGGEPQRTVLSPDGNAWSGAAKAEGAVGYVAVVSMDQGGVTQIARITWGDVPDLEPAAAPAPHDHGEGDHGEPGHTH